MYRGQLVENIKTLTLVEAGQKTLTTANMSSCKANPYPAKPEITSVKYDPATKTVVVQTKNTISTDYVDVTIGNSSNSFFWEKDGKGQYRATLSDPYYKSIIVDLAAGNAEFSVYGSFEPNYWRNSVRYTRYPLSKTDMTSILPMPALSMSRTCNGTPCATIKPGDTYAANYTTTDATSISYKCTGPVGSSQIGNEVSLPLQLSGNTSSYESLVTGGWIVGSYTCTYTIVGPGGTISPVESFSISN